MALLTDPYQQPNFDWLTSDVLAGGRLQLEAQQQQQSMAAHLADMAQRQAQAQREAAYRAAETDRLNHALEIKEAHDNAQETRLNADETRKQALTDAQVGWYGRRGTNTRPAATPLQPVPELPIGDDGGGGMAARLTGDSSGNTGVNLYNAVAGSGPVLSGAHVTTYSSSEPGVDSDTAAGRSAIGALRPDSVALSRDLEAEANARGIHLGQDVDFTLADGTKVLRHWDDRTAAGLTGRVDFYTPDNKSPFADAQVINMAPAGPGGVADPAPNSPSAQLIRNLTPQSQGDEDDDSQTLRPEPADPALTLQDFQMPPAVTPAAPNMAQQLTAPQPASPAAQIAALIGPDGAARVNAIRALELKGIVKPGSSGAALQQELAQGRRVEGRAVGQPKIEYLPDGTVRAGTTLYKYNDDGELVRIGTGTGAPAARLRTTFQDGDGNLYEQMGDGSWKDGNEPPAGKPLTRIGTKAAGAATVSPAQLTTQRGQALSEARDAQREIGRLTSKEKVVGYPWEEGGKMYRIDENGVRQEVGSKAEYDLWVSKAQQLEQQKASLVAAKARAEALQAQIDGKPAPAAPAPAPQAAPVAAAPTPAPTPTPAGDKYPIGATATKDGKKYVKTATGWQPI